MEFITVDYIDQVKERIMPFLFFVAIPCLWWWFKFVSMVFWSIMEIFFTIEYETEVQDKPVPKKRDDYDCDFLG